MVDMTGRDRNRAPSNRVLINDEGIVISTEQGNGLEEVIPCVELITGQLK